MTLGIHSKSVQTAQTSPLSSWVRSKRTGDSSPMRIEDLNVRGMTRNRRLARAMMDGGFREFRRQLEYKARFYGATIIVAVKWFPSSKTCSCCCSVKAELALSQRLFRCSECGFKCDRDKNAALNLERLAASSAVSACGEERSGAVRKSRVKRASRKQEPNRIGELA